MQTAFRRREPANAGLFLVHEIVYPVAQLTNTASDETIGAPLVSAYSVMSHSAMLASYSTTTNEPASRVGCSVWRSQTPTGDSTVCTMLHSPGSFQLQANLGEEHRQNVTDPHETKRSDLQACYFFQPIEQREIM